MPAWFPGHAAPAGEDSAGDGDGHLGGGGSGQLPQSPSGLPRDRTPCHCTDPDSRHEDDSGRRAGDTAQAAVEAASQISVAHRVTKAANDLQPLAPMVAQIKPNAGQQAPA